MIGVPHDGPVTIVGVAVAGAAAGFSILSRFTFAATGAADRFIRLIAQLLVEATQGT